MLMREERWRAVVWRRNVRLWERKSLIDAANLGRLRMCIRICTWRLETVSIGCGCLIMVLIHGPRTGSIDAFLTTPFVATPALPSLRWVPRRRRADTELRTAASTWTGHLILYGAVGRDTTNRGITRYRRSRMIEKKRMIEVELRKWGVRRGRHLWLTSTRVRGMKVE